MDECERGPSNMFCECITCLIRATIAFGEYRQYPECNKVYLMMVKQLEKKVRQ